MLPDAACCRPAIVRAVREDVQADLQTEVGEVETFGLPVRANLLSTLQGVLPRNAIEIAICEQVECFGQWRWGIHCGAGDITLHSSGK